MQEMPYDAFIELVRNRRSVRNVKSDPIPDEFVTKILEAGRWGMSGGNGQPWEFIVVKNQGKKDQIAATWNQVRDEVIVPETTRVEELRHPLATIHTYDVPPFAHAPVLILVCGDKRTYQATIWGGILMGGESSMEACYLKNMATPVMIMHLAAASLGLGSAWVTITRPHEYLLKQILKVPPVLEIHSMMAVGYPAYETPPGYRRELSEIVHYEEYDPAKYRSAQDVVEWLKISRSSINRADSKAYGGKS
jgi:5,6-dimethylbenzimidazole synthase